MADRYWVGNGGAWSETAHWSASTGGAGGETVPTVSDAVIFDANSFSIGSQMVDLVGTYSCASVTWENATNTPEWRVRTNFTIAGSLILASAGMIITDRPSINIYLTGTGTINTYGTSFNLIVNFRGTYSLGSDFTTNKSIQIGSAGPGNLTCGSYNLTAVEIAYFGSGLDFGSGTHTLTKTSGSILYISGSSGGITCGTSTIKFEGVLTADITWRPGISQTWNNIEINTTGAYSCTMITTSTIVNDLTVAAGSSFKITENLTLTVTTFTTPNTGTPVVIRSTTTTNAVLAKSGGGVISCDYINIDYITGSPTNTWYMGDNSTDGGHNTNIYFTTPPSGWSLKINGVTANKINGIAKANISKVNGT